METILAVIGGFFVAGLVFYVMGQRIKIIILQETITVLKQALARPVLATFTEAQVQELGNMIWKNPGSDKKGLN